MTSSPTPTYRRDGHGRFARRKRTIASMYDYMDRRDEEWRQQRLATARLVEEEKQMELLTMEGGTR